MIVEGRMVKSFHNKTVTNTALQSLFQIAFINIFLYMEYVFFKRWEYHNDLPIV